MNLWLLIMVAGLLTFAFLELGGYHMALPLAVLVAFLDLIPLIGLTLGGVIVFAALLLLGWLFSSGTLRSRLRVFINKHFFSYRYDYRQEWLRFTSLLATRDGDLSVGQRSIQALAEGRDPGDLTTIEDPNALEQIRQALK